MLEEEKREFKMEEFLNFNLKLIVFIPGFLSSSFDSLESINLFSLLG